jgi:glycerophosphoryl diester phosphodiesterase
VIGHRGAAAVAPENTLEALAAGVAAGADAIEFDVGGGLLLGHSISERPSTPVYLDDALELLREHDVGVHIDLKLTGIEDEIVRIVARHDLTERTLVSSTWARSLRRLATIAPELTRVISWPRDRLSIGKVGWPQPVRSGATAGGRATMLAWVPLLVTASRANGVSLHHALVSPALVRVAGSRGWIVLAWTVNDAAQIERVSAAGVDAVVSDDPARALEVVATLNPL